MNDTHPADDFDESDKRHIARLQAVRDSGGWNMFTELKAGLNATFPANGRATYRWVTDNWELFRSGEWTDVDTSDVDTSEGEP